MSGSRAAILGGGAGAGAVVLVGIVILLIWFFCLSRHTTLSRTSETASSDPSLQVGRHVGIELSIRETRRFQMDELSLATKNFSHNNLIGVGKFGEVYKGLLHDGMLVAIKKRHGPPTQEFIDEVRYLAPIQHRNLVNLLGYCQENNLQFLIYEYIPNGSVSGHLYGVGQHSREKLEFKHRLSIALGAAKGLAYLHSLSPRLVHKNFKTANVLVDENFIAKVADAGLRNFLGRVNNIAGPSSQVTADEIFLAPEVKEFRRFSEKSDVYSFGVFLLELVSGREATEVPSSELSQNLVEWVCGNISCLQMQLTCMLICMFVLLAVEITGAGVVMFFCFFTPLCLCLSLWLCHLSLKVQNVEDNSNVASMIDGRMGNRFTTEGMEELIALILQLVHPSSERRPVMSYVVMELDKILEKEMSLTTVMGEGTPTVILGSQLFRASK